MQSPESYGLKAENTPIGFSAIGLDGEVWIAINHNGIKQWIKSDKINEFEIPKTSLKERPVLNVLKSPKSSIIKRQMYSKKAKPAGTIKTSSNFLWVGDPLDLFQYSKTHTVEQFMKDLMKKRNNNVNHHGKIAKGSIFDNSSPTKQSTSDEVFRVNYVFNDGLQEISVKIN
jgi:hypothetical protein